MVLQRKLPVAIFALLALFLQSGFALIVWNGKIVAEWPEEHLAALRKANTRTAAKGGFGFYAHPQGITYALTMIVDFSDQPAVFTATQVNDWLNTPGFSIGGTKGSVRDYYLEVSNGQLDLRNDVFGYYRAKKPKSYYEGFSDYLGSDELVNEMMDYFDPMVDFSKYDNDKNGSTEAISFVYAGSGKTWGQGLWPHSGNVNRTCDGVHVGSYNMSDMGNKLTLYVFCHETGHMLFGWPDLYWFGDYSIMGNRMSDVNPEAVNDFYRADQGWIPTVTITTATNAIYKAGPNQTGFRLVNPAKSQEMFFWSTVKNTGRWSNLLGKGILLYHFDRTVGGNTSGSSRGLYVVEADGNNAMAAAQWPNPGSAASDFFYAPNKSGFSASTTPASQWGLRIYNIGPIADTMTFSVGAGTPSYVFDRPNATPYQWYPREMEIPLFNVNGAFMGNFTGRRNLAAGLYFQKPRIGNPFEFTAGFLPLRYMLRPKRGDQCGDRSCSSPVF